MTTSSKRSTTISSQLAVKTYSGVKVHYRTGTSDERILTEVIENRCYRKANSNFDVEPGETWLDLGANIGAFAVYCKIRGAKATCYEPHPENFAILKKNVKPFGFLGWQAAVTHENILRVPLYFSTKALGRWHRTSNARQTVIPNKAFTEKVMVPNQWGGEFVSMKVDGVKMDIEGSEMDLIDHWYIPKCNKLIMEYHTSKDPSVLNLMRRLHQLKQHFVHVKYPPEFDRMIEENAGGGNFRAFFDRLIYCWEPRRV